MKISSIEDFGKLIALLKENGVTKVNLKDLGITVELSSYSAIPMPLDVATPPFAGSAAAEDEEDMEFWSAE